MEFPHRLASLLLVTSFAVSTAAEAVSLSDAQLRSRLGQRLDLRLELQHAPGEEPSIRLAPAADYARLGIDPPSRQMGELSVEREAIAEGREQIRVRSTQRVSEPILTLLLEVREGNTRLIREFTTFVDPPSGSSPSAEPAPAEPPVMPLLGALTMEPSLAPSTPPTRPARPARSEAGTSAGQGMAPAPAIAAQAPAAVLPPLPRFQLDEGQANRWDDRQVVVAAVTAAWLRREFGGEEADGDAADSGTKTASRALPAPTPQVTRMLNSRDAPPPPWRSFLVLVAVTIGIFAYARRLRQRLMSEAKAELALEAAPA
ncbi:FimV family protein [Solimonas sp. SE-A11]|uniref:type IV pilus assembly protein FimV n=1 Tax=Solimonas sp. SE-A11 TaxID=3054954 RepID=UPI00259C8018|nr:hypothetical protein [Solimonas sp. SE-A11]MDM4772684.1 hypothetical protein [Solimonas sp. SE-A11]